MRWNRSEGRPVLVQPSEQLGVDGVGSLDAVHVRRLPAHHRKLAGLAPVQVAEDSGGGVTVAKLRGVDGLEQSAADDLEALIRRRRPPRRLHPADDRAQPPQGFPPAGAADLDGRTASRAVVAAGGGNGYHQQGPVQRPGGFGEQLGEAEVCVEGPAGQGVVAVQDPGVGHPLVDQDQARPGRCQYGPQSVARTCARPVGFGHQGEPLGPAELPGQLPP